MKIWVLVNIQNKVVGHGTTADVGDIRRDDYGRINGQCRKCKRWADSPVSLEEEKRVIDSDIRARGQK